jgi:hypothetical protein
LSNDPTLACISVRSYFTAFFDANTPSDDIEGSKSLILSNIKDGMQNDKYTSDVIKQVLFASDEDDAPRLEQSDTSPVSLQNSEPVLVNEEASFRSPVWIPIFVTLLILMIAGANIVFIRRRYKRSNSSAKVQSSPKTLASFVSTLEGVPTPKMDSSYSDSSESVDERHLDCFDELQGPPYERDGEDDSSISDHFSRESNNSESDDRIVLCSF